MVSFLRKNVDHFGTFLIKPKLGVFHFIVIPLISLVYSLKQGSIPS